MGPHAQKTVNRAPLLGAGRLGTNCIAACVRCDSSTACRLCHLEPQSSVTLLIPDTPQYTQSQDPSKYTHQGFTSSVGQMPKDIGGLSGPSLSFNKHSQYVAERVSGRNNFLRTTEGNTIDDLQGGQKIDHQLQRSQPTRGGTG